MAAVKPINDKSLEQDDIARFLTAMRDFFGDMRDEAEISQELYDLDIENRLTQEVKKFHDDPILSSFEALESVEKSIISLIHSEVTNYLHEHNDIIDEAYRVSKKSLHYAIVLKEDSFENEAELIDYKIKYDQQTPIANRFPLIFSFPQKDVLDDANLEEQLEIG